MLELFMSLATKQKFSLFAQLIADFTGICFFIAVVAVAIVIAIAVVRVDAHEYKK